MKGEDVKDVAFSKEEMECPWHRNVDERAPVGQAKSDEPITMRIGCGGGGFGDAIATRPCARLLSGYGSENAASVFWATRFPLVYDGLIETVTYDEPKGQLLELHWAIYPEGILTFYDCYYDNALELLGLWQDPEVPHPHWSIPRKPRPVIALNLYAGIAERRWPVDRWQAIADRLMGEGWIVIQPNMEPSAVPWLNGVEHYVLPEREKIKPQEIAELFSTCAMYLGNHSALWQIAMGVGCPSVTVHGLSCPHWFNVNPQLHRTIEAKGECRYCYDRGPWNIGELGGGFDAEKHESAYKAMRNRAELCGQPCIDHSVDEVWWMIKDHLAVTWRGGAT